ncbi:translation initiation factor 2, partial [Rhodovulum iodosum]
MKANFALDLSPDGLTLLHRSGSGWTRVGEAALDAPDLGDTLKLMRSTASALEGGGVMTKLILPESHVLYTRLPIPEGDAEAQEAAIRAGLDGLTPYKVEELVFDWQPDGEGAQVAVVARETLDEAETFAAEHRFNPVCFVAAPGDGRFPGEPWFGLTGTAAGLLPDGETLERDAAPPAEPAPAPEPEEEETAAAADEAPAGAEAPPTESTEQDPSPEADDLAEPDIPTAEAQDRLPEADDPAEPDIPAADAPEAPAPPPDDSVPEPPGTSAATRAAFATQRAGAAPEAPR